MLSVCLRTCCTACCRPTANELDALPMCQKHHLCVPTSSFCNFHSASYDYLCRLCCTTLGSVNKKLSYRRDSAHLRSLRHSRSFKVIDFDTNGKPVCDFLFVNSTNLHPISHRFPITAHAVKLSPLTRACLLLML